VEFRERRQHRRFPLQQSAVLSYDDGELVARARNVSLGGVFLSASQALPDHASVQVLLSLEKEGLGKILLKSAGKVVRSETAPDGEVGLAIEFEEKLSET
jgi:hypothetical protein